jgi:hypothetical protein
MLSKQQLENLRKSAAQRTEETKQRLKNASFAPMLYMTKGVHYLRIHADSESEVSRTLRIHRVKLGNKGMLRCQCTGNVKTCTACQSLEELRTKFPEMRTAWMYDGREISIVYVTIFSTSDNENKHLLLEEPMLLIGDHRLADELSELIQTMPYDELQKMLNPEMAHNLFEMKSIPKSNGKGTNFSLVRHWDKKAMEPLPKTFPPLSQCIYPKGQAPDPKEQDSFIKAMEAAFEGHQQGSELVSETEGQKPVESEPEQNAPHQVRTEPEPPQQEAQVSGSHLNPANERCFGQRPPEQNADCLMCEAESDCIEKTNSKPRLSPSGHDCFGQHPVEETAECNLCDHEPECSSETEARLRG